ncbi:phospholipase D-like domain-containing protein [Acidithiobacillus caldus]
MELMNQPFTGQLGNRLIELLKSDEYQTLYIVVAFAKNSGILRIIDAIRYFRDRGGKVNVYLGIDLEGTSYEALINLLLNTDSLNVIHAENGQTFHPKIYLLLGPKKKVLIVGSHNLTGGGLWTNFESSIIITLKESCKENTQVLNSFEDYINAINSLGASSKQIKSLSDIDQLLKNGYILKEVVEQISRSKTNAQDKRRNRLFGNGVSARIPSITKPGRRESTVANAISIEPLNEIQTIWFETRRMTGGSRNILDLSMRSLIERGDPTGTSFDIGDSRFMRGGVEFFGLNPNLTNETKTITINFEGIDYLDNKILFPSGNHTNGTWRLQIKGISSSGKRITETFREKEDYYLVQKIITFTKVQDNYYYLSVFPKSMLNEFENASRILARNGSTRSAKELGLF